MKKKISTFNLSTKKLNFKIQRALFRYHASDLKNALFYTLAFFGLITLLRSSQNFKNHSRALPKEKMRNAYIASLLFSTLICGFLLGKSPNPMESLIKTIKIASGTFPFSLNIILTLILLTACSLIGNKIICGWACPFGALQELLFISSFKIKKYKIPFYITNSIRTAIFLIALILLFGQTGNKHNVMLYHYISPFNLFTPCFKPLFIFLSILLFLTSSLFFYRPFCQLICPFGLFSWILEHISLFKIQIDKKKCTHCKVCYKSCPTGAIENKVMNKKIQRDCFSCGRCLNQCPTQAIRYDTRTP